jgi:hypothetical protein
VYQVDATGNLFSQSSSGPSSVLAAYCNSGDAVLGGGYDQPWTSGDAWPSAMKIASNQPVEGGPDIQGWGVTVINDMVFLLGVTITVTAICASVPTPI